MKKNLFKLLIICFAFTSTANAQSDYLSFSDDAIAYAGDYSTKATTTIFLGGEISENLDVVSASAAVTTPILCNGGTATVEVTPSGVVGTATYSIDGGVPQASNTFTSVTAGIHNFTVHDDGNATTASATITVNQPAALNAPISIVSNYNGAAITCDGASDGVIAVDATGGTGVLMYRMISPATSALQASNVFTGLSAHINYTFEVQDANNCTAQGSVTIIDPDPIVVTLTPTLYSGSHISCPGANDGELTTTHTGGTLSYEYSLDGVNFTADAIFSGLAPGTHNVTVRDVNGCLGTASFTIVEPTPVTGTVTSPTAPSGDHIACNGAATGSIDLTPAGGSGTYTYLWSNGATTEDISGLMAGAYSVTVTDQNLCTSAAISITLTEPTALTASTSFTGVLCNGQSNGTATVTPAGGAGGFNYLWDDPSAQTTATATGLAAGTYNVTVTDANNCTVTASVTVTEPAILTASTTFTGVLCNGQSNGTATVTPAGGTAGFTYVWDDPSTQTTATATGLAAGTYNVTVTDANGCTATASATVTEPTVLIASTTFTGVSCNGLSDGTATVTPAGGTIGFNYLWDDPSAQTTATATGLAAGTYNVTVTDANGCTTTASVTVTEPAVLTAPTSTTAVLCNGQSNGTATVTPAGGTASFNYLWDDPSAQTTATATGLAAGTYNVTVTDANGCTATGSATVTEPAVLTASTTFTGVLCNGQSNGTATATPAGGTAGFNYLWDDPSAQTNATATGLATGTYNVTVTDANGCTATASVMVTEPAVLTASTTFTGVSCNGLSDGTATVTPAGGTSGYTYLWDDPSAQTNATATGLATGTYNVTVTDANGCTATASVMVTEPAVLTASTTFTGVSCNGLSDGTATVTPTGGTTNFTYLWDDPGAQTTATAAGLVAGTYNVMVTDANGCTATGSVTVTEPAVLTASTTFTGVSCNGLSDGTATVTPAGGTAMYGTYIYLWDDPGAQTTATATGLAAGTYNVTVTDMNGCTATASVMVTEPAVLTAPTTFAEPSCNGLSDGTATVTPAGGTTGFTYLWDDPSAQTTATATGLAAGTYNVTVTDANGCTATGSVTVTEPTALDLTNTSSTDADCIGTSTGTATVNPAGGTPGYSYLWDNGQTTQTATGLIAGTYFVTVTDANNCMSSTSVTVNDPTAIGVTATETSAISCIGNADGEATAAGSGGSPGYTYVWSDGQTTATAIGLVAGTYNVTATDMNGCQATTSVTLNDPAPIVVSTVVTSTFVGGGVSCNGASDAQITITASGGTGATYTYSLDGGAFQSGNIFSGLAAGPHVIQVMDANGCIQPDGIIITEPAVLDVFGFTTNYNGADVSCNGASDGDALTTVTGGSMPYSYLWATGETTPTLTGVTAGTYTVTVTDANGCTFSTDIILIDPPLLVVDNITINSNFNGQNISCNGATDGAISVTASGGTGAYEYSSDGINFQTSSSLTGLGAGTHTITVRDVNGCLATMNVTLTEPNPITISTASSPTYNGADVSCAGEDDGGVSITPLGGTGAYTYLWSNGATTQNISAVGAGTYTVTVTDANGCTMVASHTLVDPPALSASATVTSNHNGAHISCVGANDGAATVTGMGGTGAYTYLWSNGQTTATAINLVAGTYTVTVTDVNGCQATASVTLNDPPVLSASAAVTSNHNGAHISCVGANDGAATVTGMGGTLVGAYGYLWSNGQTTATAVNLIAGTYTVTVTDANGCQATASVTLNDPPALTASPVVTSNHNGRDISCVGASDGAAAAMGAGGTVTTGYTYLWSDGQTTATATNLVAGTYTVTVTDNNGCTATGSVTVNDPPLLSASIAVTSNHNGAQISCVGASDGEARAVVMGGTAPYTYLWSNGQTTETAVNLSAGTSMVTVTDANGCQTTAFVTLLDPPAISATAAVSSNFNGAHISCTGEDDGTATVTGAGGTGAYTYLWSNGQTTQTAVDLVAGTYTVTVTDANGCTTTASVTLNDPSVLTSTSAATSNFNGFDVSCHGATDGEVTVIASGGTGAYEYSSDGTTFQSSNVLTGLGVGSQTITVRDVNGCTHTTMITLTAPVIVNPVAAVSSSYTGANISCNGAADGAIMLSVTGGTGAGYTFAWSTTDGSGLVPTDQNQAGLTAGTYTVITTDMNGCLGFDTLTLVEPTVVTATSSVTSNYNGSEISCNGATDGEITAVPAGGTIDASGYGYSLDGGASIQSSPTFTGLGAGTYTITVFDGNLCFATTTVTLTEPTVVAASGVVSSSFAGQDVSCNGATDGTIDLTASGGTGTYTYLWSNGSTDEDPTGLGAGTYTVTVTDVNGCTTTTDVTVTEPTLLIASPSVTTNYGGSDISCNGANDAGIGVIVGGGTAPYSYLWGNGVTTATQSGLAPGVYEITVTDINGCTATNSVTVTEPDPITATATVSTIITCSYISDGRALATPSGGTAPFTYLWSDGQTTQEATNLAFGSYSVTVTDVNNCTTTASVTLNSMAILASSYTTVDISCTNANDGEIDLTVTGGVTPYTFQWLTQAQTEDLTGLDVGTYTVTITDAVGCSLIDTITINEPAELEIVAISPVDYGGFEVSCNGGSDGDIDLEPTGGTLPYSFIWSNGATTEDISGLTIGTYNVTITDANGCTTSGGITLTEPNALVANVNGTTNFSGFNISCNGGTDGTALASITGGVAPYSYSWSTGSTAQQATGLSAGTHTVTVTDANGCTTSGSVTLTEPTGITLTPSQTANVSCNGATDASISIAAAGGTGVFTYAWSTGATTTGLTGIGAGSYAVTVTDQNGCTASQTINVSEPDALTGTTAITNVSCFSGLDGAVDLTVSGGTAPYSFAWSNASTSEDLLGVGVGTYTVTITDVNNCMVTVTAMVTEPAILDALANATDASCNGATDGLVALTILGGTQPYTFSWSNGSTANSLGGVGAGTYNVTVTDANGCTTSTTATVNEPTAITTTSVVTNVDCNGNNTGSVDITVTGGTTPYTYNWGNAIFTQDLTNAAAGTYTVTITDAAGCQSTHTATITESDALISTGVVTNVTCNGANDGTIVVNVSGGTPTYSYTWSAPSITGNSASGLTGGTYSVTVSDANGCTTTSTFNVAQPAALAVNTSIDQAIDCNGGTGSLSEIVSGGTAPYTITWTDAVGNPVANPANVTAGTYTASATDANGCTGTSTITITEPTAITIFSTDITDVKCAGGNGGSIVVHATGGTGSYTYAWGGTANVNGNSASGLTAGNYTVTITDFNGCTTSANYTITEPAPIVVMVTSADDPGTNTVAIATASVTGGTAPYSYQWDGSTGSQTGSTATNLTSGTYTVIVTDANGCSEVGTVMVQPTSVTTVEKLTKFELYPNPTSGQATINIELSQAAEIGISIYNVAGIMIQDLGHNYTDQQRLAIDLSDYASGMYLVRFRIDDQVFTKKLVLTKH